MIEILTLFLGLYSGEQTVELTVKEPVVAVEFFLDGEAVDELVQPPWTLEIDLGEALEPHELTLVARDATGIELERERRWINLGAEASTGSPAVAGQDNHTAVILTLDQGTELPTTQAMQTWFSADDEPLEVLSVEEGAADVVIVRDPVIQPYLDRIATFFLRLALEADQDWEAINLENKEEFLDVSRETLRDEGLLSRAQRAEGAWERWNDHLGLGKDVSLLVISPRAAPVSRIAKSKQILNSTAASASLRDGLLWHATRTRPLHFRSRIADAVAMAGLEAYSGHRRRAVLLLMGDQPMSHSRYPLATVKSYLRNLGVPLFVWNFAGEGPDLDRVALRPPDPTRASSPDPARAADWGDVHTITYPYTLTTELMAAYVRQAEAAAEVLRLSLRQQRIVWLRGTHIPNRIQLAEIPGVTLAGGR